MNECLKPEKFIAVVLAGYVNKLIERCFICPRGEGDGIELSEPKPQFRCQ